MKNGSPFRLLSILLIWVNYGCDLFTASTRTSTVLSLTADLSEVAAESTLQLTATGGVPPYIFSLESNLVNGAVDASSGLYTAPASAALNSVVVTDSVGTTARFEIVVNAPLSLNADSLLSLTGEQKTLTPLGGVTDYTYAVSSGLGTVDSILGIFSSPWRADTSTVTVTDAQGNVASLDISRPAAPFQMGTDSTEFVTSGGVDSEGNVYFAGATEGTFSGQTPLGGYDAFVVKLNSQGVLEWVRQFGTTGYDKVHSLVIDSNDNIYVVGEVAGALGENTQIGSVDCFVQSFSTDGSVSWSAQFGTTSTDRAYAVNVDNTNGYLYVAGHTYGNMQGVNAGNSDLFLAQYSLTGTPNWIDQSGTAYSDIVRGVAVDPSGYVYITGSLGYATGANPSFNGVSYAQWVTPSFVVKYSSAGSPLWTIIPTNGGQYPYSGYSLVADSNGGVYVAYRDDDALVNSNYGSVVVKYSTHDGSQVWANDPSENYSGYYLLAALSLDAQNNPVLVSSTYNYNSEVGLYQYQAAITKFNTSTGAELWAQTLGDIGGTTLGTVSASNSTRTEFFMMGVSNGSLGGYSNAGIYDAFVSKYDTDGVLQ